MRTVRHATLHPCLLACGLLAGVIAVSSCSPARTTALTSGERFAATTWSFDHDAVGSPPAGATIFSGSWAVRAESGAPSSPNALCQTATAEFPAIGLTSETHRDMRVTAQVKPISGREDQAAGVLLRVRDAKNYYIVRANALEGSIGVFTYVDGRRTEIKSGSVTVAAGSWQELRGEVVGTTIRGFVNGRMVVEADDATFQSGGAGLWTKADSVTCFDDVTVGPVSGP